ncbi:MAG: cupin domain-containing protein [Kiritimatiellia bacterium]|nr:cupin domain-containing protein [Lentisphaerota bacterium]
MNQADDVKDLVRRLDLRPHPEGGYYRETYRAAESIPAAGLPPRYAGPRSMGTAIIFLLPTGRHSRWHRLRSDEIWHFYAGAPLELYDISAAGELRLTLLGEPLGNPSAVCQAVVPAGHWFAARPRPGGAFALTGCTVAPGFDFQDFELADNPGLCQAFQDHASLIRQLA